MILSLQHCSGHLHRRTVTAPGCGLIGSAQLAAAMADGLRRPHARERAISYGWHPATHIKPQHPTGYTL